MKSSTMILAAMASLVFSSTNSAAADKAPVLDAPEVTIDGAGSVSGWYVRGDLGYAAWTGDEGASYRIDDGSGTPLASGGFDSARFSNPVSVDGGLGYQFTDIWRADLTADFFKSDFSGTARTDQPCPAGGAGTGCSYGTHADMRAYGIMANGYVDLATVAGFTPYLGAGVGVTNVRWDNVRSQPGCVNGSAACSGASFAPQSLDGDSSWRFTYALMAGVSYEVAKNIKLDVGYRFSDIAGGDMFTSAAGATGHDDGLARHEFRVGLRVTLW